MAKKKENSGPTIERIKSHVELADKAHSQWWKTAEQAYKYAETDQKPANFPDKLKVYAQINRVGEAHDVRMGLYSSAKPEFTVQGRGADAQDKGRTRIIQSALNWVQAETGLTEEVLRMLQDFDLPGLGCIRASFDPYRITRMRTLGMAKVERLLPANFRLDPGGVLHTGLDGRFSIYKKPLTLDEFQDEYAGHEKDGKELDLEEVFDYAMREGGMDAQQNSGKDKKDRKITICEYEYYLVKPKHLVHPVTGKEVTAGEGKSEHPIKVPMREYRLKVLAGDTELTDFESETSELNYWRKIFFPNNGRYDSPYSDGAFVRERPVQDLINVMVSMSINGQARNMNGSWKFLKGSILDINRWMKDASEGQPLEFDYTEDMKAAGVPPQLAEPHRDAPGQMDMGWFRMMDWVFNKYENVSIKNVIRGEADPGVKSGYGINLLQNTGMQPNYYSKAKLEAPFKRVGEAIWACIQNKLPDEIELPVKGETGELEGVTINHVMKPMELGELIVKSQQDDPNDPDAQTRAVEMLKMISIRNGEDRVSLEQYLKENDAAVTNFIKGQGEKNVDFVLNDIQYGDFDVSLVIDTLAEQTRAEKMNRVQLFMPMLQQVSPRIALEYAFKALDEPKAHEILKKVDEEMQAKQQALLNSQTAGGIPNGAPENPGGPGSQVPVR